MLFPLGTIILFLYLYYSRAKKLFASFITYLHFIIKKINNVKFGPSYILAPPWSLHICLS